MENEKNILTAEEIASIVAKAVEANTKAIEDKFNKLPSFKEEEKKENKKEINIFDKTIRDLYNGKLSMARMNKTVNSELSDGAGNYLVPQEYGSFIMTPNQFGFVRSNATVIPMNEDKFNMPYRVSNFTGAATTELQSITASNPVFGSLQLDATTYNALVPVSDQLLADSSYPLQNLLSSFATEIFSEIEDSLAVTAFSNLGTVYTSSLTTAGAFSTVANASGSEVVKAIGALEGQLQSINLRYADNASFIMNPTVFSQIKTLTDSNGRPILDMTGGTARLFNYPVVLTNKMVGANVSTSGSTIIAFGNLKNIYLGDRQIMEVLISRTGADGSSNYFIQNMTGFRFTTREDVKLTPSAFVTLKLK